MTRPLIPGTPRVGALALAFLVFCLGLNLLLLLEGPDFSVFVTIRQAQPDVCHVGEGNPRFALSKRARHL
jgi:hypothetical protein